MPKNEPVAKFTRFLGVNNREDPADMGVNEAGAGWLVDANNVDLTNAGKIQGRPGQSPVAGIGGATSVYATQDEKALYYVATDGTLYRVDSMDPLAQTALATGIAASELHWAEAGNLTFFCGASKGIIVGNDVLSFGIPTAEPPGMSAIGGSLPAGRYLATVVLRDEAGREGGCAGFSGITLQSASGIQFNIPPEPGYDALLYLSRVNGETLFYVGEAADGYTFTAGEPSALALDEAQLAGYPPPAGADIVAFHESRIWVSEYDQHNNASFIYPSKPFWYHLFPLDEYVPVGGRVLMMASVSAQDGSVLLIGTDEAIYAYNGNLAQLADYGVVPGHQLTIHDGKAYFWTQDGLCTGLPFQNLTNDVFSVPPGTRAGLGVRKTGGMDTLIISTDTGGSADNPRQ